MNHIQRPDFDVSFLEREKLLTAITGRIGLVIFKILFPNRTLNTILIMINFYKFLYYFIIIDLSNVIKNRNPVSPTENHPPSDKTKKKLMIKCCSCNACFKQKITLLIFVRLFDLTNVLYTVLHHSTYTLYKQ